MKIPDMLKSIVTLLYVDLEGSLASVGTAFYVALTEGDTAYLYLVTCKQVIDPCLSEGLPLYARPPASSPRSTVILPLREDWATHRDPAIDLAVLSAGRIQHPRPSEVPALLIEGARLRKGPYRPGNHLVSWGDTALAIGLLPPFDEQARATPVARMGHVSALPADPLPGPWGPAPAMLVDCQPLPGGCGGPVFASFEFADRQTLFPLGVSAGEVLAPNQLPGSGLMRVLPFDFVVEILFGELLTAQRQEIRRQREALPPPPDEEAPDEESQGILRPDPGV